MITLAQTNSPSAYIVARAKKMWVRSLSPFEYRVVSKKRGKVKRLVRFSRRGERFLIECQEYYSGVPCPANQFEHHCAHVEAALRRLAANEKRKQKAA